jgi:hypothetical protein
MAGDDYSSLRATRYLRSVSVLFCIVPRAGLIFFSYCFGACTSVLASGVGVALGSSDCVVSSRVGTAGPLLGAVRVDQFDVFYGIAPATAGVICVSAGGGSWIA